LVDSYTSLPYCFALCIERHLFPPFTTSYCDSSCSTWTISPHHRPQSPDNFPIDARDKLLSAFLPPPSLASTFWSRGQTVMRGTQNSRQGALAATPPPVSPSQVVACGRCQQILALCYDRSKGPWFIDARRCVPLEAVQPHVGSQGFSYCFLCALPTSGFVTVSLYPSANACHDRDHHPATQYPFQANSRRCQQIWSFTLLRYCGSDRPLVRGDMFGVQDDWPQRLSQPMTGFFVDGWA
jgi:hypothetical protein